MTSRIAITGASSRLGTVLAQAAKDAGSEVVALSRTRPQDQAPFVRWHRFDLSDDPISWVEALEGTQTVVHLASATAARFREDPAAGLTENVMGVTALVDAMKLSRVSHLVLAAAANVPDPSGSPGFTDLPRTLYLASKLAQEWAARAACHEASISCAAMRISSVIGDGKSAVDRIGRRLLGGQKVQILHGDSFGADLVGMHDVVAGLHLAAKLRLGGVYNVSSGRRTTIGTAAREMIRLARLDPSLLTVEGESAGGDPGFHAVVCDELMALGYKPTPLYEVLLGLLSGPAPENGDDEA